MQILVRTLEGRTVVLSFPPSTSTHNNQQQQQQQQHASLLLTQIKQKLQDQLGLPLSSQCLYHQNRLLDPHNLTLLHSIFYPSTTATTTATTNNASHDIFLHLSLPLAGGKGGFGSLLRSASARVGQKVTTNFTACRDLSGRRLRHVEFEKQIREWQQQSHDVNPKEMQEEFKAIKDGRKIERRLCKFGDNCKYKYKCKLVHPGDEEMKNRKPMGIPVMNQPITEEAQEQTSKETIMSAVAAGLKAKQMMQKKRKEAPKDPLSSSTSTTSTPSTTTSGRHEHELERTPEEYQFECDKCGKKKNDISYCCVVCDYDECLECYQPPSSSSTLPPPTTTTSSSSSSSSAPKDDDNNNKSEEAEESAPQPKKHQKEGAKGKEKKAKSDE